MSKADDLRVEYEAKIAQAELEDQLVELKAARGDGGDGDDEELRRVKNELRAARQAEREARETETEPEEGGE